MLKGKKIILGITGSIAAYKAAIIVRLLVKESAQVQVVMTPFAKEFIKPLTLATLSNNPVSSNFFSPDEGVWKSHVSLGTWADMMLIAPASANTMAKMANGIADNLLLTTYLSAKCPVAIAPAMDIDMFKHPATLKNLEILKSFGNIIIEPPSGELASGLIGKGRMEEPEKIVQKIKDFFNFPSQEENFKKKLKSKKFLVTAGPTYEAIDPVRFIGNYSSGKMGFAIAKELAEQGAFVTLIYGPSSLELKHSNIKYIEIVSAQEMYDACIHNFSGMDCAILAAAVADFTPEVSCKTKLKKDTGNLMLKLIPTRDIAVELGRLKNNNQLLVGFALETENEIENARLKIEKKNLDFIVINSLRDKGAGFKYNTNKICIIDRNNKIENFDLKTKSEVARDIVNKVAEIVGSRQSRNGQNL